MNRTTEKIPTWSLAYIINGDTTALTDDEVQTIDRWMKQWQVQDVSPLTDEEGNAQPPEVAEAAFVFVICLIESYFRIEYNFQ